jgi:hypothetical protein
MSGPENQFLPESNIHEQSNKCKRAMMFYQAAGFGNGALRSATY